MAGKLIGQVTRDLGLNPRTLRYYESLSLDHVGQSSVRRRIGRNGQSATEICPIIERASNRNQFHGTEGRTNDEDIFALSRVQPMPRG